MKPIAPDFFSAQVSAARRFYLDLNTSPSAQLAVVCGGSEHCAPDYRVRRADFRYYSVEFVARGEGELRIKGRDYHLGPGSLFAYGPGVAHDIRCNPKRPLVKHFVDFVGKPARRRLADSIGDDKPIVQTASPERLLRLFDELTAAGLKGTPFSGRICSTILDQLLLVIAETAVPLGTIGTMAFETYQRCGEFIEQNYLNLRTVNDAADRCRIDPAYLCRLFARFHHQSPYQYLMALRMRHAAGRLEISGALVKEVAAEMEFSDPFQFSRTFRRVLGISPRRFVQLLPERNRR